MSLSEWAMPQLSKLLPLDEESLKQIIDYSASLSKDAAAEHLKNLLGDSPHALEFINAFNSRRPASSSSGPSVPVIAVTNNGPLEAVPKSKQRKKKAADFKRLPPPRQVAGQGQVAGGYVKKDQDEYMAAKGRLGKEERHKNTFGLQAPSQSASTSQIPSRPSSTEPVPSGNQTPKKLPPSASGRLISDSKPKTQASKAKAAKVSITGGTPMQGSSTALTDLDYAIRALEIQTNPSLAPTAEENAERRCNCMATRHELLAAAPNCLNCGKVICVKEGLGPCTFCHEPLLSASEINAMVRILREERGKEKMSVNNAAYKRADVSKAPRPFSGSHQSSPGGSAPTSDTEPEKLSAAMQHRDKLLAFQTQNTRRTRIHDEAADFETPTAGQNMWASPTERALQLKKQQKALRAQEWNARPDWEKRKMVASIDLVNGKIIKRMAAAQRPASPDSEEGAEAEEPLGQDTRSGEGTGSFRRNPLLGGLIRPVFTPSEKGKQKEEPPRGTNWRRVQDDNDDNEQWILDGGVHGVKSENAMADEPECG
jgi:hypothetical protein